jgi:hypothetical protein
LAGNPFLEPSISPSTARLLPVYRLLTVYRCLLPFKTAIDTAPRMVSGCHDRGFQPDTRPPVDTLADTLADSPRFTILVLYTIHRPWPDDLDAIASIQVSLGRSQPLL